MPLIRPLLFTLITSLFVTGCAGYALRSKPIRNALNHQSSQWIPQYPVLQLSLPANAEKLRASIVQHLHVQQIQVVSTGTADTQSVTSTSSATSKDLPTLRVIQLKESKYSLNGGLTEIQLALTVDFLIENSAGQVIKPQQTLRAVRSFQYDQHSVNIDNQQELIFKSQLQDEIVQSLTRQLLIKPQMTQPTIATTTTTATTTTIAIPAQTQKETPVNQPSL